MIAVAQSKSWGVFQYALFVLLLALGLWTLRVPLADVIRVASRDAEQTHIFLAPIVALWLLWVNRAQVARIRYQPSLFGPVIIAGAWIVRWLGFQTDMLVLTHLAIVIVILGAVVSMVGIRPLKVLAPVFLALLFMLPIPGTIRQEISLPLQGIASSVTFGILEFFGVDAQRAGHVITVNGNPVNVGEACNGMRMIFALTLVTIAFVFSMPLRTPTRLGLIALSPLIAVACNVIRLIPTAFVYGYGDAAAAAEFHDIAGWIMLPIALFIVFGIVRLLQWLEVPVMQWRFE